jgi:hypothetical protein
MSRSVMTYPRSLPWGTLKGALFWVSNEVVTLSGFHDDVVDIDLQVAPYLPIKTELDTPLVSGPCVL